jgi:plasmid replication initiation protein
MDILQVPTSYKLYSKFKQAVLQVAEKELIEHCDIFFEYEEIKEGKRVNEILFRIKKNHWLQEEAKDNQGTFKETLIDAELMQYIGKTIYQNGYDWKIISISKNKNLYSIFCHEETDRSYTKTFEVSEVQLKASK